jgi:UDP-N-acetylglucosamine 2-epimerase (non-hydrolysing)
MSTKIKIINVVGARPNFMKIAPIITEFKKHSHFEQLLVHTGQHYDEKMSKLFFQDLNLPKPNIFLGIGSGSHAEQTGKIMIEFEKILIKEKPDLVNVVGDVNSTLACSLAASKMGIKIAHIEAGLRSFDRSMPEEINRIVTDHISDFLFVTEKSGYDNLIKEGIDAKKIHFVGNVMIDTLLFHKKRKVSQSEILNKLQLINQKYCVLTLHRPGNVDSSKNIKIIMKAIKEIQKSIIIVWPIHPRTKKSIKEYGFNSTFENFLNLKIIEPLGYLDFLNLMLHSTFMLTDSGGIQEETTALNIPCLTLRPNTERPVTIEEGTNKLLKLDCQEMILESKKIINGGKKEGKIPYLWDGKSAERIVKVIKDEYIN